MQTWIGPSEVGDPCNRSLIARVMEVRPPLEPPNWKATVGTAVHEHLERMFVGERYICETPVLVGYIGGREVIGSVDVYDRLTHCVIDWKTKSRNQMQGHKRNGAGAKYEVQAQLYGLGVAALGWPVSQVMEIFLPRDGELADAFYWSAPYDPLVGFEALQRADSLYTLASAFGIKAAQQQFPPCTDQWRRTCADVTRSVRAEPGFMTADNPFAPPLVLGGTTHDQGMDHPRSAGRRRSVPSLSFKDVAIGEGYTGLSPDCPTGILPRLRDRGEGLLGRHQDGAGDVRCPAHQAVQR